MPVFIEIALRTLGRYTIGRVVDYKKLFAFATKYELLDRLYRRYVRFEDIEATRDLIGKVFDELHFDKNLREKFEMAYEKCIKDVKHWVEEEGMPYGREDGVDACPPIRIVNVTGINTDNKKIPDYVFYEVAEGEIPLEDYDNLEGLPFWMRPEYVFEKY